MRQNPIKEVRLRKNLTQRVLASYGNVTVGAVIKHEQGLYVNPSPRILDVLSDEVLTSGLLTTAYRCWQDDLRESADLPTTANYYEGNSRPVGTSPFLHYRTKFIGCSSRMAFCKLLALHPSIVAEYEAGRTKYMPVSIYQALIMAGVKPSLLAILDDLGKDFYARLLESSSQRD